MRIFKNMDTGGPILEILIQFVYCRAQAFELQNKQKRTDDFGVRSKIRNIELLITYQ